MPRSLASFCRETLKGTPDPGFAVFLLDKYVCDTIYVQTNQQDRISHGCSTLVAEPACRHLAGRSRLLERAAKPLHTGTLPGLSFR